MLTRNKNKKYYVTYAIDARYIVEAEGRCLNEILDNAESAYLSANFGAAHDIGGMPISVQDEEGSFLWEA